MPRAQTGYVAPTGPMKSRPGTIPRGAVAAVLAVIACLAAPVAGATAQEATLQADFHFNNRLTAPTGQAISEIGSGNAFVTESIDTLPPRRVLTFPTGSGLSLNTTALATPDSYSVVMLFRLDDATGRRKLLDFAGGMADAGLYLCDGELLIELLVATPCSGGGGLAAGQYVQVVLTRDASEVRGYLNGVLDDSAPAGPVLGTELRFFQEDGLVPADPPPAGAVARIRIYDGALTVDQVNALDRVDTVPPDTTIDSGPSTDGMTTVTFSSPDASAEFECWNHSVGDTAPAFTSCTSPKHLGQLGDGAYVFEVRAVDAAGNPDPSPATQGFTVDTTAPDTGIVSGPAGPTNDATPDFAFGSTESGDVEFECWNHSVGDTAPAFTSCTSPMTLGSLGDGAYVFEVRAVDAAGNRDASPELRTFQVDTIPPRTTITGGPGDTTAATAVFLFSAPGAVRFSCRLDGGAWQACDSPRAYPGLSLGPHQFDVRAVDAAGNEEPTPAHHAWQVLRPGLVIPAAVKQATALARELVQIRRALARVRLRTLARRRAILFRSFDALTAGTVEIRARARVRQRGARRWTTALAGEREVPGAGRHRVRATVTKKGRRLARRRRTLPVELRLSFTDLAGRSLWATAELTLGR